MKRHISLGALSLALLMLVCAGCRSSKKPSAVTEGQDPPTTTVAVGEETDPSVTTSAPSGDEPETQPKNEEETLPPETQPTIDTLPYASLSAHKAGDTIFNGNEWTGTVSATVGGGEVLQTNVFAANRMKYH